MTITDQEASALLARTNRRMSAREVLARKQPPSWQRVALVGANAFTFYLATQMRDSSMVVNLMLAGATSLALAAGVELWNMRRRVDALTVLLTQPERDD